MCVKDDSDYLAFKENHLVVQQIPYIASNRSNLMVLFSFFLGMSSSATDDTDGPEKQVKFSLPGSRGQRFQITKTRQKLHHENL